MPLLGRDQVLYSFLSASSSSSELSVFGPGIEKDGRDPDRNMADGFRDYTLTWRKWNMDAPIAEPSQLVNL
ncbi:hypothetical protein HZH68_003563 [Vespula germanica]|uniref:Uncharacterized protein n=1 Tax=Vespula germanica TaxID=30212 RepID=A0A834NPH3_VESGE|nr:hypothetical protein HZH68_003563 [Vespula germanica]